jgi:hypothetical protein
VADVVANAVNVPAAGVVPPITALLIVPPLIVGLLNVRPVSVDVASSAVAPEFTTTALLAFPLSVGSLLKPASIRLSSARKAADDPGEFGVGYVV